MADSIRILHLEDDPVDAELVQATLAEAGLSCHIKNVMARDEFETILHNGGSDIILADFQLPMYDGMSALRLALQVCPDIPFIFVSGMMGEEAAIEGLTQGATDYVLKQNLTRLASAVKRAVQEAENLRDRRQAEEALQASEARYIDLYENAPDMYLSINAQTALIEECNHTLVNTLESSKEEIIDQSIFVIYHPDCLNQAQQTFTEFLERGEICDRELQLHKNNGSKLDVSLNMSAVRADDGTIVSSRATLRDITERKQVEESFRKLHQAVEQSPASIVITDLSGTIEFVNRTFTQITGYTADEAIGENPRILQSRQTLTEEYSRLWQTIRSGGVWRGELRNRKKNGELFWEQATIAGVRNAEGVITHYVAVKDDITERKLLKDQFRQSQKLEAVGQLAGGVAHDFNNMLGVIIGYAEMTLEKATLEDSVRKHLEQILAAGHRSADITRQLLAFARKQTISPKHLNLNETVEGMLKLLRPLIGEDIELAWLPETKLWPVKMDPTQIDQLLANLCVNARDAIVGVGKITIETHKATFDDTSCSIPKGYSPGEYVILTVSDDGCGMDKATMDKIFEPFFTTKEVGKGTGMGLATVYGIVKQNAGFINVYSEPGIGSTIKIYLPRHEVTSVQETAVKTAPPKVMGNETILLVEDDIPHLLMVKEILERYGYRVLAESDPEKAFLSAKEHMGKIHLLLTDIVMPGMNGRDLAIKITALDPGIICFFMSGYTSNVIVQHGVLDEGIHFIQKPFSIQVLAAKVRELLDSKVERKKTMQ